MSNLGEKIENVAACFCIACMVGTVLFVVGILLIQIIKLFQ